MATTKSSNSRPLVSIVILNWNGLENTEACLESLKGLEYDNYEVIVVDNGSSDGSKAFLKDLPDITYVDNPSNRGFAGGHIDGLKVANGDYIFLLNNDAVVKPDIITQALKTFESDQKVGAVGGRVYHWNDVDKAYDETNSFYSYQIISPFTGEARTQQGDHGITEETNTVSGSGVFISREVINEIGYLHEPFFAYYEETDLFARMKRYGYKVLYNPAVRIWHLDGASTSGKRGIFFYLMWRNRMFFAARNFDPLFFRRFLLSYLKNTFKSIVRAVLRRDTQSTSEVKAALYVLGNAARIWSYRRELNASGTNGYNRKLLQEQSLPVCIAVDCRQDSAGLKTTMNSIVSQTARPFEVLLVATERTIRALSGITSGVRISLDRELVEVPFEDYASVLARTENIVFLEPGDILEPNFIEEHYIQGMMKRAGIVTSGQTKPDLFKLFRGNAGPVFMIKRQAIFAVKGIGQPNGKQVFLAKAVARHYKPTAIRSKLFTSKRQLPAANLSLSMRAQLIGTYLFNIYPSRFIRSRYHRLRGRAHRNPKAAVVLTTFDYLFNPSIPVGHRLLSLYKVPLGLTLGNRNSAVRAYRAIRDELIAAHSLRWKKHENSLDTPVFIISRDRLAPLLQLVDWLEKTGLRKIFIIDNGSSYPPLLEYFKKTKHQVLQLDHNAGHTSPWNSGAVQVFSRDAYYIVSDPDVIPAAECPNDVIEHFYKILDDRPAFLKVGFGLKIDDLPDHYRLKQQVINWEQQFWQIELEPGLFEAGVDTTFALYRPHTGYFLHPSIRTGEPYVARHLPWYADSDNLSEEDIYYRNHANKEINSWDTDFLPERYRKEMNNAKK